MSATLTDICRATGFSKATISRVINESSLVCEPTRKKVLEVMRELDYHPSYAARTLARKCTDTLGVIFPRIHSGFYAEVLRGIDDVASQHGLHLITAFAHGPGDEEKLVTKFLMERRVDALLLLNLDLSADFTASVADQAIPVVSIDRPAEGAAFFSVTIDNAGGSSSGMTHLIEHGYRDIAVLAGPDDSFDSVERLEACRATLAAAGRGLSDDRIWQGAFTEESGHAVVTSRLNAGLQLPNAVFALNDAMALGALMALKERGIHVSEDVALVGFDDCDTARHVGLTTVHVPMWEMGCEASRAAVRRISDEETGAAMEMTTELVVRTSCGCG